MSAALDKLDADLAACRADLTAHGFRVFTATEHRNAFRREVTAMIPGEPISEPDLCPPTEESQTALAELLADLRRLEADAADLRTISRV